MRRGKKGGRNRNRYVRATAMFPVDDDYLPKGAESALRGRASGEFAEAIAEVMEKAIAEGMDLSFSLVHWRGEDNPVLSIGAVEPRKGGGKRRRRYDEDDEDEAPRWRRKRDDDDEEDAEEDEEEEEQEEKPKAKGRKGKRASKAAEDADEDPDNDDDLDL